MANLDRLLRRMIENKASDLHLLAGAPPKYRIRGELEPIEGESVLTQTALSETLHEILDPQQKALYLKKRDLDFAYSLEGVARFRCNYFVQRNGYGAVFRIIPQKIKTLEELALPPILEKITQIQKGLVLVTGPTGSGKSTTLAAIIDRINSTYPKHILTIEDPIEFVHENKRSLIRQREVGADTLAFATALRAALREDVDVVLVGEMRDLETIGLAITLAETGVLVFGTLHTSSAAKTIDRIIDVFPVEQQEQIRIMLSDSLRAVLAQQLIPTKDGRGRVAVIEIMLGSPAVANVIREAKTQQILSIIQSAKADGMQSLDSALMEMIQKEFIGAEEAYMRATDKKMFEGLLLKALLEAASNGQLSRIDAMIKEGVSVNQADESGVTPLMLSAQSGHAEVVKLLLLSRADVDAADNSGATALIRAAQKDQTQIVRILIAAEADVNKKNNNGQTALNLAAGNGFPATAQSLIDAKADPNIEDNVGATALIRATIGGHTAIAEALLHGKAQMDPKDKADKNALMYACERGNATLVDAFIRAGADVNLKTKTGATPLIFAARAGGEAALMLMQAGADIHAQTQDGYTALHYAAEKGHASIAGMLIKLGADVNTKTRGGVTPLMWAAKSNAAIVRELLAAKADSSIKTSSGFTALKYAEESGQTEIAAMLRETGAKE